MLGRPQARKKGFFEALSQLWTNSRVAEARDTGSKLEGGLRQRKGDATTSQVFLQDIPAVLDEHDTAELGEGALFGELAA